MVQYALIGCGRIARRHLEAALAQQELAVAALCDLQQERAQALARQMGLEGTAAIYTDYRAMLRQVSPQLAAVATDSGSHEAIGLDCLDQGCHLLVEKPMALSLAGADRLIRRAQQTGRVLAVCHQNRFNPAVQALHQQVEAGRFGRIYYGAATVRWRRDRAYYQSASWRGRWDQDGGALMNQCIHNVDLLCWMLGEPTEVFAYTDRLDHPYIQGEDFAGAVVRFGEGRYGLLEGTTLLYPGNLEETLCLFGREGTVKLGGQAVNRVECWRFAGDSPGEEARRRAALSESIENVYGNGHRPLYEDWVRAVATGSRPLIAGEEGRRALELVLAVYRSAADGRPIALPLGEGAFSDYQGRFAP